MKRIQNIGLQALVLLVIWGVVQGLISAGILTSYFQATIVTICVNIILAVSLNLGMAEIIRVLWLNFEFTNGAAGLSPIPQFLNWTWVFVFTAGTIVVIRNFLNSRHGHGCIAVREDEIAAESIGVRSTRVKTLAFTVGAFFGALAGGLYASYFYFVKPDLFNFMMSINILVIVVLGGLGSLSGSVIAAVLLAVVSTLLQPFPEIRMIIYALVLVVLMVFRPEGLMGSRELSLKLLPSLIPGKKPTQTAASSSTQEGESR